MELQEVSKRSAAIRKAYHALEREYHGSEWSAEEDALAFLTDAGLVGRLTMSHEGRCHLMKKANSRLKSGNAYGGWPFWPTGRGWIFPIVCSCFWQIPNRP